MNNYISLFFDKSYEIEINTNLLENDYIFPKERMLEYVRNINGINIHSYLEWLNTHFFLTMINVEDAVQYSSFDDVRYNISRKMILAGDDGFNHLQIGKILQDDGIERKEGAYTKYGENHAKTASYLGYLFSLKNCYYVSSIGYILDELSLEEQNKLFARLFVRTNLFKIIYYLSQSGNVELKDVLNMLSEKTYVRRRSNIKKLFSELCTIEPECSEIVEKIIF